MKKSLIFASIACAGAFALHAEFTYNDWFKGIGTSATSTNNINTYAENGAWDFSAVTAGDVSFAQGTGLTFDLEEAEHIDFDVIDGTAPDTNTFTKVVVTGVFTPVRTNDLPNATAMDDRQAQVGFVVGIDNAVDPVTTNYYAWTGGNWFSLGATTIAADAEATLTVTFDYTNATARASFAIGNSALAGGTWYELSSEAAGNKKVSGVSCYGSGKVVAANGSVGIGAVMMDGVKYGSVADAANAAGTQEKTIKVVRATSGDVTLPAGSNITIEDPSTNMTGIVTVPPGTTVNVAATPEEANGGRSGSCTIELKVSGSTNDVEITFPNSDIGLYKEAVIKSLANNKLTFDLQTKSDIVTNVAPAGKQLRQNETRLREFLNSYVSDVYNGAESSKLALENALKENDSTSGRALWKSYVLGVEPSASLAPVTAPADTAKDGITLTIPAGINPTGDYTVTYQVGAETITPPASIKVPLETGTKAIKIKLD